MKLRILSDLHLEFSDFSPPPCPCDAVILAGDIALGEAGVQWIKQAFPKTPVFYVLGNHEFYKHRFDVLADKIRPLYEGTSIRLMECDEIVLGGVRFLGATLWTDFQLLHDQPLAMMVIQKAMSDYSKIRTEKHYRRLKPKDTLMSHLLSRFWLGERLAVPFDGKTVVITHHAPSGCSLRGPRFQEDSIIRAAYASELTDLMGHCDLWVHGHTHDSCDYVERGTRIVSNPRGYIPYEPNPEFNPQWVIDL